MSRNWTLTLERMPNGLSPSRAAPTLSREADCETLTRLGMGFVRMASPLRRYVSSGLDDASQPPSMVPLASVSSEVPSSSRSVTSPAGVTTASDKTSDLPNSHSIEPSYSTFGTLKHVENVW